MDFVSLESLTPFPTFALLNGTGNVFPGRLMCLMGLFDCRVVALLPKAVSIIC